MILRLQGTLISYKYYMKNYILMYQNEFKGYNLKTLKRDVFAGLAATFIALPLALALGISNGLDATAGIKSAILGGFIIGFLGGGRFQINGATASTTVILSSISLQYGINGVLASGILVATTMLLVRISKLAKYLEKIPTEVLVGLNAGIGLLLIAGEIDNFLGVSSLSGSVFDKFIGVFAKIPEISMVALVIGILGIIFLFVYPKKWNRIIASSIILLLILLFINYIFRLPVTTIDKMPSSLTFPISTDFLSILSINFLDLVLPSINVAIILMIKSITCGLSSSKITETNFDVNTEISALSIGNYILPFFGCVPSASSFSSTQVAIMSGGKTRLTSLFHSLFMLIIILFLAPIMSYVPIVGLSSILLYTGLLMIKKETFKSIPALITFLSMLFFDISVALIIGILVYLFINKKDK